MGQKKEDRIRRGLKEPVALSMACSILISLLVWIFAPSLMVLFVSPGETAVIREGTRYLRIEGAFYAGIDCLFLLYGLYRALGKPAMSLVLAYALSAIEVVGIWWSVPIGWTLADIVGILYYLRHRDRLMA